MRPAWVVRQQYGLADLYTSESWPRPELLALAQADAYRIAYHMNKRGSFRGWIAPPFGRHRDQELYVEVWVPAIQWGLVHADRIVDDGSPEGQLLSELLGLPARPEPEAIWRSRVDNAPKRHQKMKYPS